MATSNLGCVFSPVCCLPFVAYATHCRPDDCFTENVSTKKGREIFFFVDLKLTYVHYTISPQQIVFANDFNLIAANTFKQLWNAEDFSDVTLATVDDHQIKVHKVILGSGSPFFKNLLLKNPQKDPIIYLKDIKHKFLEMVLRFIYMGEVEVAQDEVEDFLNTAADLKISGLVRDGADKDEDPLIPKLETEDEQKTVDLDKFSRYEDIGQSKKLGKRASISYKGPGRSVSEEINLESYSGDSEDRDVKSEVYNCPLCDYKTTRTSNLYKHKWFKHRNMKRPCNLCDYQAERRSELKEHTVEKHSGHIFKCNICHYGTIYKSDLKKHVCNPK